MWKICILLVICSPETIQFPSNQQNTTFINWRDISSERIRKCNEFKNTLLDIPRQQLHPGLHENIEIKHSERKGYFATIKENTDAFEILGVSKPISYIIFDPQEYQWRRLPSSCKRYES